MNADYKLRRVEQMRVLLKQILELKTLKLGNLNSSKICCERKCYESLLRDPAK